MHTGTVHTAVCTGACAVYNRDGLITSMEVAYLIHSISTQRLTQHIDLSTVRRVGTDSIESSTSGGGKCNLPHHTSDIKGASYTEQCHGVICRAGNQKCGTVITQRHSTHEPGDGWGGDTSDCAHHYCRVTFRHNYCGLR